MTAADLAVVLVTVGVVVAVALLMVAVLALLRALRHLRRTLLATERHLVAARVQLESSGADADRIDELLADAEGLTAQLEGGSRIVRTAVTNPVVKVLAFFRGTGRTARTIGRRRRRRARAAARRSRRIARESPQRS